MDSIENNCTDEKLLQQLEALVKRWRTGIRIYKSNLDECRTKNLAHDGILGSWSTLIECEKDLSKVINNVKPSINKGGSNALSK